MTDPEKLRLLAALQDKQDADRGVYDRTEVQDDLRRIADWIEARANPNIEAAHRAMRALMPREWEREPFPKAFAEIIIEAALTPLGDTE